MQHATKTFPHPTAAMVARHARARKRDFARAYSDVCCICLEVVGGEDCIVTSCSHATHTKCWVVYATQFSDMSLQAKLLYPPCPTCRSTTATTHIYNKTRMHMPCWAPVSHRGEVMSLLS